MRNMEVNMVSKTQTRLMPLMCALAAVLLASILGVQASWADEIDASQVPSSDAPASSGVDGALVPAEGSNSDVADGSSAAGESLVAADEAEPSAAPADETEIGGIVGDRADSDSTDDESPELKANSGSEYPADGDYVIRSTLGDRSVLDVSGGSADDGANVQIYQYNGTNAQRWHLAASDKGEGLFTIASLVSGKVLDVAAAGTYDGANVQTWTANGTDAQLWRLVKSGSFWRIESVLKSDFALDIAGGSNRDGTNAHAWTSNGTAAQLFELMALKPDVKPSTALVANGAYIISNANSNKVLDVSAGSRDSGANVQQWTSNSTYAQRFWLESDGAGFYRVFNLGSGLALDVNGADLFPGANVQQWSANDSAAQLWSLRSTSDGNYIFISKANGLALDVNGASKADGGNLQVYTANGTKAQAFKLTASSPLSDGVLALRSAAASNLNIDVPGASSVAGTALEIYTYNDSLAQKVNVRTVGSGVTLQMVCSGLYATADGSNVVQGSTATPWSVSISKSGDRRGPVFSNSDGKAITAKEAKNAAALVLAAASGEATQAFLPVIVNLLDNGIYTFTNVGSGKVLDVASGSWANGANIQQWTANGTGAQAFYVENLNNGYYRITSAMTGRAVDVNGGINENGTNVQQYTKNNTGAQQWKPEYANGRFVFVNRATGKLLDVDGGSTADGANVQIWERNGTDAQGWKLSPAVYTPDPVLQEAMDRMRSISSSTQYCIAVDRENTRVVIFEGRANNWTPISNLKVSVGAPETPTVTGHYTVGIRGYSFGHDGFTCYYYTQFYGDYLFHSVKYVENTFDILDGRLGEKISEGCVRMPIEDAKWIYDNIPSGTHVYVYN